MSNPIVELVGLPGFHIEQHMGSDFSVTELFETAGSPDRPVMSVFVGMLGFPPKNPKPSPSPVTNIKGVIVDEPIDWRCWQNRQPDQSPFMCETTVPWERRSVPSELVTVMRVSVTGNTEAEVARYRRLAETQIRFVSQVP